MKYVRSIRTQRIDDHHFVFVITTNAKETWTTRRLSYDTIRERGYVVWVKIEEGDIVDDSNFIPKWMIDQLESYGWMLNDPKQRSTMNRVWNDNGMREDRIRLPFKGSEYARSI